MLAITRLSLDDARALIAGAEAWADEIGVAMCIAVCDEAGHLIAFQRMDGAKQLSIRLSDDKAYSAAISKRPTQDYNEICLPGELAFGIHTSSGGRFSIVGGGYPVIVDEVVVGAIGVSGGTVEQDMECARYGISAFFDD